MKLVIIGSNPINASAAFCIALVFSYNNKYNDIESSLYRAEAHKLEEFE